MDDLISRKALLDDNDILEVYTREYGNIDVIPVEIVEDAPTIEAEPVRHGRWICLEPEIGLFECESCGHKILRAKCNYCPSSGAKMDG